MENKESNLTEVAKKRLLRSQTSWKIGDTYTISYVPSVEGMVVATRWMDESFMVIFIAPPYQKEGGSWAESALVYKNAAVLVREPMSLYDFPFPKDKRIIQEVTRANGNMEMLQEVINFINKSSPPPPHLPVEASLEPSPNPWDSEVVEAIPPPPSNRDRLSLHLLLSQQDEAETRDQSQVSNAIMEKILQKVAQTFSLDNIATTNKDKNGRNSDDSASSMKNKKKSSKKKKKSYSSSSSTSSSSSSLESSSSDSDVRVTEGRKGWVKCPFSLDDNRLATEPRKKMRSMRTERVILRKALQNIYNEYTSVRWFVETIRQDSLSSQTRPYNSDITWLHIHANYLDQLLLQPLAGPWRSWNELIVDQITRSFLELVVRASPDRSYPDVLEEKVRKWMKKKRVGLTSQFGTVPAFLADAKVTEAGIQPKGGWELLRRKDTRSTSSASSSYRPKQFSSASAGNDKKA